MADASIEVYHDQIINLINGSSATMLVLPISLGLTKGATLTIYEIDSLGSRTSRLIYGTIAAIASGEFYNLPTGQNQYYINPMSKYPWIDYSADTTTGGWSVVTQKFVNYAIIGETLFFNALIAGTSNSGAASFSLPFAPNSNAQNGAFTAKVKNAGVNQAAAGLAISFADDFNIYCYLTFSQTAFTGTGSKSISVSGFFPLNP